MSAMPILETDRLRIRPMAMADETAVFHIQQSIGWLDEAKSAAEQRQAVHDYVRWCSLNHAQLARLHQPPLGDRVVIHRHTGAVIGLCGLVPYVDSWRTFPYFRHQPAGLAFTEMGLYWAIAAAQQGQGYATEVAQALIGYAFDGLNLHHVIATTEHDNLASQRVMVKAGMRLERNPSSEPPWQQVLGILENPKVIHRQPPAAPAV